MTPLLASTVLFQPRRLAAAAGSALAVLPAVGTVPNLVGGTYRAVSGYSGPLIRIVNAGNTASQDISAGADGYVDTAAILSFAGVASIDGVKVDRVYDQTGGGNTLTQTTDANRPQLMVGVNGKPCLMWPANASFALPAGYSVNAQAVSFFLLGRFVGGAMFQSATSATSIFQQATTVGLRLAFGNSSRTVSTNHYQNRAVTHMTSSASALKIGQDGTLTQTASAAAAGTTTGGMLGNSNIANTSFVGEMEVFAFYPAALSDADAGTVATAMRSMGGTIPASRTRQLVLVGDSLTEGTGASFNRNRAWYMVRDFGDQTLIFNRGKGGRQLATLVSTDYSAQVAGIYNPAMSKNVLLALSGINDLVSGATASALQTSFQNFASLVNATGWQWLAYNLPAYNATEPNRTTFNTWLTANFATYANGRIDLTQSSIGGGQPSSPSFYFDAVHPNSAGYEVWETYEINNGVKTALGI